MRCRALFEINKKKKYKKSATGEVLLILNIKKAH